MDGPCIHRLLLSVCLREDYLKTMFAAVTIEGNNQALPIAFGPAMGNNLYLCTWFLVRLKEALRQGMEVGVQTSQATRELLGIGSLKARLEMGFKRARA
uniref:Uncharacterized protein n=1 Tax=Lactuca sativa TaxID=4236 RepID=A0A9R1WTI0_LACSA|nr:hypothetical protein LSAT_V11C100000780 [Lactuca sativa]